MKFGDTVWVVIDGEIREGEIRGTYYNGGTEDTDSWGVWMTEQKEETKFKMFTFYAYEIFTDREQAKKAEFKAILSGRYVKA